MGPSNEYSGVISFRIDGFDLALPGLSQESSPASQLKSISSPKVGCVLYLDTMLQAANTGTDVKKASG